jgi:hypothetical protein
MSERKPNAVAQSGNLRVSLWHVMFSRAEIPVTFLLRMPAECRLGNSESSLILILIYPSVMASIALASHKPHKCIVQASYIQQLRNIFIFCDPNSTVR